MRSAARATSLAAVCLAASACGSPAADGEASLAGLKAEVAALRERAAARLVTDPVARTALDDSADILVALRTDVVQQVMSAAARRYLDDVKLHIRPDLVVREDGDVRAGIGPIDVRVGSWQLAVTIHRIDATLRADSLALGVDDSARLRVRVPVHVLNGSGSALIDFRWDAARVTGVICNDFEVRETFTGYVEPRSYEVAGWFVIESGEDGLFARPVVPQRLTVSPQPTEQSWRRVRALLDEQNHIFNCGLALSPPRMEAMLRDLLTRGFRFRLPESILRPLPLPASIADEVDIAGRRVALAIRPRPPRLTTDWLWLSADLDASLLGPDRAPPAAR